MATMLLMALFALPMYVLDPTIERAFECFSLMALIYVIAGAGYIDTVDADPSIETAKALFFNQKLLTFPMNAHTDFYFRKREGGWYSKLGLSTPVLYLPVVALANVASHFTGLSGKSTTDFLISFFNAFVTALIITLLYLCLARFCPESTARLVAFIFGVGTSLFPYSKSAQREPLQALSLLGVFIFATNASSLPSPNVAFALAGVFVGLGVLTKLGLVIPLIPAVVYASVLAFNQGWSVVISFFIPVLMALSAWLLFAKRAYGGYSQTGYNPTVTRMDCCVWKTKFLDGIAQQWLSLKTGFFFYNPALLIVGYVVASKLQLNQISPLDLYILATVILRTCVYAKWKDPTGDQALGPRYLVAIIPLFGLLFINFPIYNLFNSKLVSVVVSFLVLWSILNQMICVFIKPQQYWTMKVRSQDRLSMPHWMANIRIFAHKTFHQNEVYQSRDFGGSQNLPIDLGDVRSCVGFNFWWLHLKRTYR